MRVTDSFIFVHLPKTGGTWMREVLETAHYNMFFKGTVLGSILLIIIKLFPRSRTRIERDFSLLFLYEYTSKKLTELQPGFATRVPYERHLSTKAVLSIMRCLGLIKHTPTLGLLIVHTRRAELPVKLTKNMQFFACMNNPLRWHISRYNFYKKNDPNNLHATDICNLVGKFDSFDNYCNKQMMAMKDIYHRSYLSYMTNKEYKKDSLAEDYRYPTEVIDWYNKAPKELLDMQVPQHYGLLSFFFIWFFLPQPQKVISLSADEYEEYLSSDELKGQLNNFSFARTQRLNQDTYEFLKDKGYPHNAIEFILKMPARNVSTLDDRYGLYYNKNTMDKIYQLEKMIFILFPQYQEGYQSIKL